ncbi:hypothetical protein [Afipia clevelandensis]|uniref:Uncharacterized protein n=1 Tax=Afipia clevelandensis ATCC 49720 TaxID=883079 RepID=K8P5N5_9BRAD|nr:hypothetical protein [Afipia clevelandensis]EKS36054.1 hypothetical protein HMPREF9696_02266 [Afipia clevelandensis ATCC 49720]
MTLPRHSENEYLLGLRSIVDACEHGEYFYWPDPTDEDYAIFGKIMWLYTGLDFVLRMTAEAMDDGNMLESPFKGKVRSLSIKRTTDAILSSQIWTANHRFAFERINDRRRLRNLIGHFITKRFVEEDAFIFMTKSASDFKQVFDVEPEPDQMLYGVIETEQVRKAIPEIERLLRWAEKLPRDLSTPMST